MKDEHWLVFFGDDGDEVIVGRYTSENGARFFAREDLKSDWTREHDVAYVYQGKLGEDLKFKVRYGGSS